MWIQCCFTTGLMALTFLQRKLRMPANVEAFSTVGGKFWQFVTAILTAKHAKTAVMGSSSCCAIRLLRTLGLQ